MTAWVHPVAVAALAVGLFAGSLPTWADTAQVVVPTRTIPTGSIIGRTDVELQPTRQPPAAGTVQTIAAVVGKEAQRSLYINRPIREHEIGPVTLVERNARVTLRFRNGRLELTTVGRALDRGSLGDIVRVMNLDSRRTIYGRVSGPEAVDVGS